MSNYMVVRHEAHTGLSADISADVTAGQAVKVTGPKTIGPAAPGDLSVGVSHHTRKVDDKQKATFRLKGDVIPMKAAGAIAAGAVVKVAAAGAVETSADGSAAFGVAWDSAAAGAQVHIIVL